MLKITKGDAVTSVYLKDVDKVYFDKFDPQASMSKLRVELVTRRGKSIEIGYEGSGPDARECVKALLAIFVSVGDENPRALVCEGQRPLRKSIGALIIAAMTAGGYAILHDEIGAVLKGDVFALMILAVVFWVTVQFIPIIWRMTRISPQITIEQAMGALR